MRLLSVGEPVLPSTGPGGFPLHATGCRPGAGQVAGRRIWRIIRARNRSSPMAKDIDNPCVSLCQLNSELCVSCGRTREEIRKWRGMKRPEKMATVQRAATRMKAIVKKNAKRQAND